MPEREDSWSGNYFTYFTEVEEHFQRVRGTGLGSMAAHDRGLARRVHMKIRSLERR